MILAITVQLLTVWEEKQKCQIWVLERSSDQRIEDRIRGSQGENNRGELARIKKIVLLSVTSAII